MDKRGHNKAATVFYDVCTGLRGLEAMRRGEKAIDTKTVDVGKRKKNAWASRQEKAADGRYDQGN